jgi:hypothetical protein
MVAQDTSSCKGASAVAFEFSETPRARLQQQQDTLLALSPQFSSALTPAVATHSADEVPDFLPQKATSDSSLLIDVGGPRTPMADNGIPRLPQPNSIVPLPLHPQQQATALQPREGKGATKNSKLIWNPRRRSLFVLRKAFNAIRCESLRSALSCDTSRKHGASGCDDSWTSAPSNSQTSIHATYNVTSKSCPASPGLAHVESAWLSPGPPYQARWFPQAGS